LFCNIEKTKIDKKQEQNKSAAVRYRRNKKLKQEGIIEEVKQLKKVKI